MSETVQCSSGRRHEPHEFTVNRATVLIDENGKDTGRTSFDPITVECPGRSETDYMVADDPTWLAQEILGELRTIRRGQEQLIRLIQRI